MNMKPYTLAISLCYPLMGRGIGAAVRGKLWDICGAWPLIQASPMRLRSLTTGAILDRFDPAYFDSSLKMKDSYILSTEKIFKQIAAAGKK
jgi:fructose-1,6-bisphosphatase/inositol monophosphatase family enzyme